MNPEQVTLRAFLELRISELEKRLDVQRKGDRKQLISIFKHETKALKLQAKEYERRLQVLNDDREEARDKEITFASQKDFIELKDRVNNELAQRTGVSKLVVAYLTVTSTVALAIGVVVAILTYAK